MQFLADMGVSMQIVHWLRTRGDDVVHLREQGLERLPDAVAVGSRTKRWNRSSWRAVKLPPAYALEWSGQYGNMKRVEERLKLVVPFTIFLILFLLNANTTRRRREGGCGP